MRHGWCLTILDTKNDNIRRKVFWSEEELHKTLKSARAKTEGMRNIQISVDRYAEYEEDEIDSCYSEDVLKSEPCEISGPEEEVAQAAVSVEVPAENVLVESIEQIESTKLNSTSDTTDKNNITLDVTPAEPIPLPSKGCV